MVRASEPDRNLVRHPEALVREADEPRRMIQKSATALSCVLRGFSGLRPEKLLSMTKIEER
jgi:hypothetical protein